MIRLSTRQLTKQFHGTPILQGLSLEFREGETVTLVGPSGSGKSTFLRCLNLLEIPDGGSLRWDGHELDYRNFTAHELSLHRRRLGMVFQQFNLFPHLSALANVMEGPVQVLQEGLEEVRGRAVQLLERVGLGKHLGHYPGQLSGGQKQRVAIARALAMRPAALLLDEVTSALDVEASAEIHDLLRQLAQTTTMVAVTHDLNFARNISDRVVLLEHGQVVEEGPPQQVLGDPTSERARVFLARSQSGSLSGQDCDRKGL